MISGIEGTARIGQLTASVLGPLMVFALLAGCAPDSSEDADGADRTANAGDSALESSRYLDLALGAERWIDSTRIETENGVAWPDHSEDPESIQLSLYHGLPGVVLFYLELHRATGDREHLETAVAGAAELWSRLSAEDDLSPALYEGLAGNAFALHEVFLASGEERFREASRELFERIHGLAEVRGSGLVWLRPMPFPDSFGEGAGKEALDMTGGAAGIGLALLYAHDHGIVSEALTWASSAGDRLIEVAQPAASSESAGDGLMWPMVTEMPRDWTAPNFSHGTAGVAYFLARLYEETGEQRYLDASIAGATHLETIATVEPGSDGQTGSRLIYHHQGDGEDLYYLSWCHGPAGTGRLFHQLAKVTGDESWHEWLVGGAEGILGLGAPEERSPGFWNNVSQCCGDAGVGEFALSVYQASGEARYLDMARRVADSLESRGQSAAAGVCWVQAEHRSRPEFLKAHTCYMQGAAGIGSFYLRLRGVLEGDSPKIEWPDSPWS